MFRERNPKIAELQRLTTFEACSRHELEGIARLCDETSVPAGATLTKEGAPGRECFVVSEGKAKCVIRGKKVANYGPGDVFGEMSLLNREPRSATVVATKPLTVFVMTASQFAEVAARCPSVASRVMQTLAQRLREAQAA